MGYVQGAPDYRFPLIMSQGDLLKWSGSAGVGRRLCPVCAC